MGQQINVNIRMDSDIKNQADMLFNDFGLNFTTAINTFVRQALRERAIPFQIRAVTQTRQEIAEEARQAHKEIAEQFQNNGIDMNLDEINAMIAEIRQESRETT